MQVLSGKKWQRDLESISGSIVFIDEDNAFMRSREFAHAAKNSDNYYVLVAREALPQLPYSVDEIYELRNTGRSSSKYPAYSRTYTSTHRVYGVRQFDGTRPDLVVVEDSNSGFDFFSALCQKSGVPCVSAKGRLTSSGRFATLVRTRFWSSPTVRLLDPRSRRSLRLVATRACRFFSSLSPSGWC